MWKSPKDANSCLETIIHHKCFQIPLFAWHPYILAGLCALGAKNAIEWVSSVYSA